VAHVSLSLTPETPWVPRPSRTRRRAGVPTAWGQILHAVGIRKRSSHPSFNRTAPTSSIASRPCKNRKDGAPAGPGREGRPTVKGAVLESGSIRSGRRTAEGNRPQHGSTSIPQKSSSRCARNDKAASGIATRPCKKRRDGAPSFGALNGRATVECDCFDVLILSTPEIPWVPRPSRTLRRAGVPTAWGQILHAAGVRNEIFPHPSFTRTAPDSSSR
jgi:hypothetical protein